MIVIFGENYFGRSDTIPGVAHVATRFFHISYFPILPLQSAIFVNQGSKNELEFQLSVHWKSVLLAYARALLILAFSIAVTIAILELSSPRSDLFSSIAWMCAFVTMLICSYRIRGLGRATYENAIAMSEELDFTEVGMLRLEGAFGRGDAAGVDLTEMVARRSIARPGSNPVPRH